MIALSGLSLASTVVFSILLAVNPKPRKRNVTLVPQLRFDRGASIVLSGRF
jgi:hypothetical protein